MNRLQYLHIIIFVIGLFFFTSYVNAQSDINDKQKDSLAIDNSEIKNRYFENLKEKYNDNDFIYERTIETSGWWTRFKAWLADLFNVNTGTNSGELFIWGKWIAAIMIFLLVIYFIFKAVINNEGQWVFGKSSDKNIIPVTTIENNIQEADFNSLISNAEDSGNYRLAVRYYYLWLLRSLTNAEIIEYDVEKTNSDYFNEIISLSVKEEFSYTSYLYNYIWYGEFDVDQQQFYKAKHAFNRFLKSFKA